MADVDPLLLPSLAISALALLGVLFWLWQGRARGRIKRLAFRAVLFSLALAIVAAGRAQGLFARSSIPFDLALAATIILVVVGNLYSVRFCTRCGKMHRNFKVSSCARCGETLPRHGFTEVPRRDPIDPTDPLGRRKAARREK